MTVAPDASAFELFRNPHRRWADLRRRALAGIEAIGRRGDTAVRPHAHIVIALDLATEPQPRRPDQAARAQNVLFRLGHLLWLAVDELHAAGRAARVAPAGVHLIQLCFILK